MPTLLEFSGAHQRFGLKLADVERVIPVTALAPPPGAPRIVMGVINLDGNLHGEIVPVIDFQQRVGLGPTQFTPAQRFIIARTSQRRLCLVVDETAGLRPAGEPVVQPADFPKAKLIQGLLPCRTDWRWFAIWTPFCPWKSDPHWIRLSRKATHEYRWHPRERLAAPKRTSSRPSASRSSTC